MAVLNLSAAKFDEVIRSGQLVFVDFWATWCRPCMMMGPIIEEIVDDDGVKDICARYGITNIPNMKLFKNGVEVGNVVGAVPKATVKGVIDKNL